MTKETIQPYRPLELMMDDAMTKSDFTDFIGVWEKFVPGSFCDQVVQWFDTLVARGTCAVHNDELAEIYGENDQEGFDAYSIRGEMMYGSNMNRKDYSVLVNYVNEKLSYQINQFLKSCMLHYINEFGQLKNVSMFSSDIKMQMTEPGGGYHAWHYENSASTHAQRELTWMIYLNDVPPENGGETEFLYQHKRISPTKGTVVVFPAGMTHVHRGNTVLKGNKYIVTGWYIKTGIA
ncbi:2OG-Fe(II) oxygenase [Synechococcus phage S-PM2]|uniref:2OG-Fe(II) oxygenase n=1 Tax=Synechococcus phage S-PM2 TaxID=238854 RepID=Q5GQB2_BPSYP|nr:2OG-Fe(II) oxygenase [Synechococcus phage S-PM2]CAF34290.2 2OG-Fe(II) oxygenase [Synechococcus phage S-PM2]CFW42462.1 2OG-Fe(II) oxygenase [Synechococcus phage S-PM2]